MPEEQNMMPPAENAAAEKESPNPSWPKKDLKLAAVVGSLCALLLIPILKNIVPQFYIGYTLISFIALPALAVLGMLIAFWLAKFIKVIYQAAKFVLVGLLNTFVDWGVLNLLIFLTSLASGWYYVGFKGISFLVATTNSYFWNKFWTFKKTAADVAPEKVSGKEMLRFFIVSCIGFALNVGVAALIVNVFGPQWGIDEKLWANVGALGGTLVGLFWNFLGYKLIVFKN